MVGVVIDRVLPDSEAERSGLQGIDYRRRLIGDVIVAVGEKPITVFDDFARILGTFKIGETINLQVSRDDKVREVAVTIMDIS